MLGANLLTFDGKVQNIPNLIRIVMPFLQKLSQLTKETINFGILEGREVACLSKIESQEALKADIRIGEKIPAHCSAIGKSLLAYLPEQEFQILYNKDNEKLPVFTRNSILSIEKLKKCLIEVRKRGYSIDREEFKIGINCLGVAIMNNEGKAIAGISVTGPSSRFNLTVMKKIKSSLMNISNDISNQLNEINNL
jgi:DNA-binding IclR family transcriptional regulator